MVARTVWIVRPLVFLAVLGRAGVDPLGRAEERPPAAVDETSGGKYEFRDQHDPNGIGKFYMGREIARVMGHQGISWLERPEREEEERLTQLLDALDLQPGMVVADIGAGSGVISVMIARRVGPEGKVLAVDIQQEMLDALTAKTRQLEISNVEPVLGTIQSPRLDPESVDLAVMVDVYHEFDFPYEMVKSLAAAIRPGGRIAFVEYRKEDPLVPIKEVHKMFELQVRKEIGQPDFDLVWRRTDDRLPRQHVVLFEKLDRRRDDVLELGGEWPQFRGPRGDNQARSPRLPIQWSETEHVAWKTPLPGRGWSSPVICGRGVWLTTADNDGRSLRLLCVDRVSGDLVGNIEVFAPDEPCPLNDKNSHASPTPIAVPGRVYVHFGAMGTAAIDADTGDILWRNTDLVIDHKEGPGGSPQWWGGLLAFTCDGRDQQYTALVHPDTGELVEKRPRSRPLRENSEYRKGYATPLAFRSQGRELLAVPGPDQLEVHARDGVAWSTPFEGFSVVPQPVFAADLGLLLISTGYMKPELWAIRTGAGAAKEGGAPATPGDVAWKFARQVPAIPTPVLVGERIVMVHEHGVATCVDARTGGEVWQHRLGGTYSASPLVHGDRVYCLSEEGQTTVLSVGDTPEVLATNSLEGRFLASPAVAGESLYLRSETSLYRIDPPDTDVSH